jgi:hypothetical protein
LSAESGADLTDDLQLKIDALRDRISCLMRENDRLEADTSPDADLEAGEQKIRENLDVIGSLASQIVNLEKQRQE